MPYATRKMIEFMKENGLSSEAHDLSSALASDFVSAGSSASSDGPGPKKKKIRELPSSVDPIEEDESGGTSKSKKSAEPVKDSTTGGSKKSVSSKKKSSSTDSNKSSKPDTGKCTSKAKSVSSKKKSSSVSSAKSGKSQDSDKDINAKVIKATTMALKPVDVDGMENTDETMTYDEKKVKFIQGLLKSNVKRLKSFVAADPIKDNQEAFNKYKINEKKPLVAKPHSANALYESTHKDFPEDCLMVCKLYDSETVDPKDSIYLKILRHLGKKHPNIIQTWDVMCKSSKIYVFQELAPYGNMQDYITKKGALTETQTQFVARQMRLAMDFLGDMGIAHRAISPSHVLAIHSDLRVKLTGFRSAIIYYDEQRDDINFQACISLANKGKPALDYQAPEVYGSATKEQFDPVTADVWSFGASLYYLLSQKYPYNATKNDSKVGDEIQKNVLTLKVSKNAHSAIGHMLRIESTKRISVDKLKDHPWLKEK